MKCETKKIKGARCGNVSIALLQLTKHFKTKRVVEDRVVIQRGFKRKDEEEWRNERMFLSTNEFRNLQNALEDFKEADPASIEGDKNE